jgi:hypothetical protein
MSYGLITVTSNAKPLNNLDYEFPLMNNAKSVCVDVFFEK